MQTYPPTQQANTLLLFFFPKHAHIFLSFLFNFLSTLEPTTMMSHVVSEQQEATSASSASIHQAPESTSKRPYTYRILQLTPAEDEKDDGQHESPFKKPKKNVADAAMLPKFEKNKSYQDDSAEAVIPQQVAVSHMCQSSTVIGGVRIKIRHLLSSEPSDGSWYKTCVGCVGICRERYHISE